jgi:hypothetical protein
LQPSDGGRRGVAGTGLKKSRRRSTCGLDSDVGDGQIDSRELHPSLLCLFLSLDLIHLFGKGGESTSHAKSLALPRRLTSHVTVHSLISARSCTVQIAPSSLSSSLLGSLPLLSPPCSPHSADYCFSGVVGQVTHADAPTNQLNGASWLASGMACRASHMSQSSNSSLFSCSH